MRSVKPFIPFIVFFVVLSFLAPSHEPVPADTNLASWFFTLLGLAWALHMMFSPKWTSTRLEAFWFLGAIPDAMLTSTTRWVTGNWAFEANPWVGSTGSIMPILVFTSVGWILLQPARGTLGYSRIMLCLACLRVFAILSHPAYWMAY